MDFTFSTEPEIKVELGKRLAARRIAQNLTQSQLATKAGIGVATLQRLEQGENATLSNFIRVVMALGRVEELNILSLTIAPTIADLEKSHRLSHRKRARHKKVPL